MVKNWKQWKLSPTLDIGCQDPGDLMANIYHIVKHNQDRKQIIWGAFIDELYKLSNIPVGFRTSEGVLLTPWSLLSTDKKTWNHRIKVQLIDILSVGQREKIEKVEELAKSAKTKDEGKELMNSIRGGSVEAWLLLDINTLSTQLYKARPNWESLVHSNVLSHLSAMREALSIAEKV